MFGLYANCSASIYYTVYHMHDFMLFAHHIHVLCSCASWQSGVVMLMKWSSHVAQFYWCRMLITGIFILMRCLHCYPAAYGHCTDLFTNFSSWGVGFYLVVPASVSLLKNMYCYKSVGNSGSDLTNAVVTCEIKLHWNNLNYFSVLFSTWNYFSCWNFFTSFSATLNMLENMRELQ